MPNLVDLLRIIRDQKRPTEERAGALKNLEQLTEVMASTSKQHFSANLSNFENAWARFEKESIAMTSGHKSAVNRDDVDSLMQQMQDAVRLEKLSSKTTAHLSDEAIKQRIEQLGKFVETLDSQPKTKAIISSIPKQRITDEANNDTLPLNFIPYMQDMIDLTEESIEQLEEELNDNTDAALSFEHDTLYSVSATAPTQINAEQTRHQKSVMNSIPLESKSQSTSKLDSSAKSTSSAVNKSDILDSFYNSIKVFLKKIVGIFKKIGNTSVSLNSAISSLNHANRKLEKVAVRLAQADNTLNTALNRVTNKMSELKSATAELPKANKDVQIKMVALQKLRKDTTLEPGKKTVAINKMKARLNQSQQICKSLNGKIERISNQLKSINLKVTAAQDNLSDAKKMHKKALSKVKKAMKIVEKAQSLDIKSDSTSIQTKIKKLLQDSRQKEGLQDKKSEEKAPSTNSPEV